MRAGTYSDVGNFWQLPLLLRGTDYTPYLMACPTKVIFECHVFTVDENELLRVFRDLLRLASLNSTHFRCLQGFTGWGVCRFSQQYLEKNMTSYNNYHSSEINHYHIIRKLDIF